MKTLKGFDAVYARFKPHAVDIIPTSRKIVLNFLVSAVAPIGIPIHDEW
ncbi:MAG: hypothetical protein KAU60_15160 [Desulfobacterales bacterium]|nr:hypothetical protein [Desulfobacterales bacterium]